MESGNILTILASIDRGSPVGKRDYAILLLITRYGLRSADVKSMEISDLHWGEGCISIVQAKTRAPLRLPLLQDVGWALIDYLKNGRSVSELPQVFLTCTVPIRAFGQNSCALNGILVRRIRAAGISISRRRAKRTTLPQAYPCQSYAGTRCRSSYHLLGPGSRDIPGYQRVSPHRYGKAC